MNKQIFKVFLFIFSVLIIAGCNKKSVDIYKLSADDQYKYAKRFFDKGDYFRAKTNFNIIVLNNPGNIIIEKAQYYLAESYYYDKEYVLAIQEYSKLIRSLPQSEFVDNAEYKIGMCYYKLSPNYALDQEYTQKAITHFQQFIDDYPNSTLIPKAKNILNECWEKLAKKEFKTGELYRKMGYFDSAVISFNSLLEKYPESRFVPEAIYWTGVCNLKMRKTEGAKTAFNKILSEYPNSSYAEKSEKELKEIEKLKIKNKEN
ncbi:outer membrane protein assembly factor BamD [bacterium]|nr:outer membrane protein assembly factor BamD [bacterium]